MAFLDTLRQQTSIPARIERLREFVNRVPIQKLFPGIPLPGATPFLKARPQPQPLDYMAMLRERRAMTPQERQRMVEMAMPMVAMTGGVMPTTPYTPGVPYRPEVFRRTAAQSAQASQSAGGLEFLPRFENAMNERNFNLARVLLDKMSNLPQYANFIQSLTSVFMRGAGG